METGEKVEQSHETQNAPNDSLNFRVVHKLGENETCVFIRDRPSGHKRRAAMVSQIACDGSVLACCLWEFRERMRLLVRRC